MRLKIISGVATFLLGAFLVGVGMSGLLSVSADVAGVSTSTFKVLETSLFIGLALMIISAGLFIWAVVSDTSKK
ncbi:hypothetical protein J7L13_04050 [bacterium]|nr:hypothetical protein [bacterium]